MVENACLARSCCCDRWASTCISFCGQPCHRPSPTRSRDIIPDCLPRSLLICVEQARLPKPSRNRSRSPAGAHVSFGKHKGMLLEYLTAAYVEWIDRTPDPETALSEKAARAGGPPKIVPKKFFLTLHQTVPGIFQAGSSFVGCLMSPLCEESGVSCGSHISSSRPHLRTTRTS